MHLFLGYVPCVVVSSPEMAKECLKTNENAFSNRPSLDLVELLCHGKHDFTFAPYGPYWQFMRKLCMSELLGGKTLDTLKPFRKQEMKNYLNLLKTRAKAGESVDIGGELIRLTNNVISGMMMSVRTLHKDDDASKVRRLVGEVAELLGEFNLSDSIWFCKNLDLQGFRKKVFGIGERFHEMMDRIIVEHEEARRKKKEMGGENGDDSVRDLLDILLDIAEDEKAEVKLTYANIKAFILDIFVAGTDASALTQEWALSELINRPHMMQKLREEIDSVVGKDRIVEESDIENLPYLQAIVKETLRLHSPAPIVIRESLKECMVAGYTIPAKTRLLVNLWSIARDPNHWENPLEFYPERFTNNLLEVRGQHFYLMPFGSGRRGCPGATLALKVAHVGIASMVQCFDWKPCDAGSDGKVDMKEGSGLTLPKAHSLVCVPVARLKPLPSF